MATTTTKTKVEEQSVTTTSKSTVTKLVDLVESDLVYHPEGYENHLTGLGLDLPTANKYQHAEATYLQQINDQTEVLRSGYTFSPEVTQLTGTANMGNYKSVNVIADSSKLTVMVNNTFGKLAKVDVTESYPEVDS